MMKLFKNEVELRLFCDIHSHSRKKNVFMYGCCYNESKDHRTVWKNLMIKVVPLLLSERNKIFSFKKCKFRVEKAKEAAARVVVFREFGILHSYTMETSFYGPKYKAHL